MDSRPGLRVYLLLPRRSEVYGGQYGSTWRRNFVDTLSEMGNDVVVFDSDAAVAAVGRGDLTERQRTELASELVISDFRRVSSERPVDLFFAYVRDNMVLPEVFSDIGRSGVPTCNFSCNNVHQFDLVRGVSRYFDYSLHAERDVSQKFRDVSARPIWFPMAANPKYYHPVRAPRTVAVSFVGQCYAKRPEYLFRLLEAGVQVEAFGPSWLLESPRPYVGKPARWARRASKLLRSVAARSPDERHRLTASVADEDLRERLRAKYASHLHRPVTDEQVIEMFSASNLSLGFLEVYDAHDPAAEVLLHVHLREFEAPMCGAAYVTNYSDELAEFYVPDVEVVMWRSPQELLEKVVFLLAHPAEAEKIRAAGLRRALACHTYEKRFRDLFSHIGLES